MRPNQKPVAGVSETPASSVPAGGVAPAPGSLTLSSGLTLPAWQGLDGLHENVLYRRYDADPAARQSFVNRLQDSTPLALMASLGEDLDSSAMAFGRVYHTVALQPELFEQTVVVADASNRNTNIYKAAVAGAGEKDVVLRHEHEDMLRMRDRFAANGLAQMLVGGATIEASVFWADAATGLRLKARPDVLSESLIADVKTTRDFKDFERDAEKYGYFRQAAWYIDGVEATTGRKFDRFLIIACEKKSPFDCRVYEVGPRTIAKARRQNAANVATYVECLKTNVWPGHAEIIEVLAP